MLWSESISPTVELCGGSAVAGGNPNPHPHLTLTLTLTLT